MGHIADGVDDVAPMMRLWPATSAVDRSRCWQQRLQQRPFGIGGVGGVASNKSNNTVQKQPLTGYVLSDRCAASPIRARKIPELATRLVRAVEPEPIGESTL
jgi:hypothetical protein